MKRILSLALLGLLLSGCGSRELPVPAKPRLVRIDWLGNQCYRFTSSLGTTLITNPYGPKTKGRTLPQPLVTDILLVTSERPEVNNVNAFDNQPATVRGGVGIGLTSLTGIQVRGVPDFRNPDAPSMDGMNLVYAWSMDGIRFCFAGSLGRKLNADQLAQIGAVDVLLLSGDGAERAEIVNQLNPRIVVPMDTIWVAGVARHINGTTFTFSRELIPQERITLIFSK